MKVGDLVKIISKTHKPEYGRTILLLKCYGMKSYNLGRDAGQLFTGMTEDCSTTEYYVFETDAEVISESR